MSRKGQGGRLTSGDQNPPGVHKNIISPEVIRLRPRIGNAEVHRVERVRQIIEQVAVKLACGDEGLDWEAIGGRREDQVSGQEAEWTPGELEWEQAGVS